MKVLQAIIFANSRTPMSRLTFVAVASIIVAACSGPPPPTPTPEPTVGPTLTADEREAIRQDFADVYDAPRSQHRQFRVQWTEPDGVGLEWVAPPGKVYYRDGECSPEIEQLIPDQKCVRASMQNNANHPMHHLGVVCTYAIGVQTDIMFVGTVLPGALAQWEWPDPASGMNINPQYLCKLVWTPEE